MESESKESGLDELMRLSQQFTRQEQEHTKKEQERLEQQKQVQNALGGLRGLTISMTVEQLKPVAAPDIIEQVSSLNSQPGTEALRKLITDLAYDLERQTGVMSASNPDIKPVEQSVKTLTILMELYFSLQ